MSRPDRRRTFVAAALGGLAIHAGLAAPAAADTVKVTVVDVAGDVAYVVPGADAGLGAGVPVQLAGRAVEVIDATATSAALRLDGATVRLGEQGTATVTPPAVRDAPAPRAAVRPLDAWRGQWPDAVRPAASQSPARVALGGGTPDGGLHAALSLGGRAVVGAGDAAAALEARVQLSAEPWQERPLGLDVDLTARLFRAGSTAARTPVIVRTAQVRWGDAAAPRIALGRLAWAADAVGLLDGVRAAGRRGPLELAGFGGVLPDPITGRPDTTAAQFGAEAIWDQPAHRWQPRLALTAVGSTWDGTLDERRLIATAETTRGAIAAAGWGEVQMFDADNPWGAAAVELAGAGASVGWRGRGRRANADLGFARPQRTARLADALPAGWLCEPDGIAVDATCGGGDWQVSASGSLGLVGRRGSLDGTATIGTTQAGARHTDASGLVLGELSGMPGGTRLRLGASGVRTHFLDMYGVEAGVGLGGGRRRWEASVAWRPELIGYTGAIDRFVSHGLAIDGRVRILRSLDLRGAALAVTGADRDAVALSLTVSWRPRP